MWRDPTKIVRLIALIGSVVSLSDLAAIAKAESGGKIASATLNDTQTSIRLVYTDGKQRIERASTPGETFDRPRLTGDRSTVGWTVYRMDGASYPYPQWLQFIQKGVRLGFICDGGGPQAWRFEHDDQVVVDCAFQHGLARGRRLLAEIGTAHVLAIVDLSDDGSLAPNAPAWALKAP